MLNLNCYTLKLITQMARYTKAIGYIDKLLSEVGGKYSGVANIEGTVVGDNVFMKPWTFGIQPFIIYGLMTAPSSREYETQGKAVFHADLHRCADYTNQG